MKITKTASGKQIVKISKSEWQNIGKKQGWIKMADSTNYSQIPENTMQALRRMQEEAKTGGGPAAVNPSHYGSFLGAVLKNDLKGALFSADPENFDCLKEIVMFIHWKLENKL